MAHIKSRSKNVVTGKVTETFYTDQEWADQVAAKDAAYAAEAARDHDAEEIDNQGRIFKAFLRSYARRIGITPAQLKADIKAEL